MGKPCDRCLGTDYAQSCAQGQCYAEWEQWQQEQQENEWREAQNREMERYYRENPHEG